MPTIGQLIARLQDAVNNGASVNFVPPLATDMADGYWRKVFVERSGGTIVLLVALHNEQIAGSV